METLERPKELIHDDFAKIATSLKIETALIKAVAVVESRGSGFNKNGLPKILFEPFVFSRRTHRNFDGETITIGNKVYPLSLSGEWNKKAAMYGSESIQFKKLERAKELSYHDALCSCSWGKFQILGGNYAICGFDNAPDFVDAMHRNEGEHLKAFANYIKKRNLIELLKSHAWEKFAFRYNGEQFKKNKYDEKLKNAYEFFKKLERIKPISAEQIFEGYLK